MDAINLVYTIAHVIPIKGKNRSYFTTKTGQ